MDGSVSATANISGPEKSDSSSSMLPVVLESEKPTDPWLEVDNERGTDGTLRDNTFGDIVLGSALGEAHLLAKLELTLHGLENCPCDC
jgi:hypothetical protein